MRASLLALAAGVMMAAASGEDTPRTDKEKMLGMWTGTFLVGVEKGRDTRKVTVLITSKTIRMTTEASEKDREKETIYGYTLYPDKKPTAIDLLVEPDRATKLTLYGIYKLEGDRLKIIFTLAMKARPTKFGPIDRAVGHQLLVLERQKTR